MHINLHVCMVFTIQNDADFWDLAPSNSNLLLSLGHTGRFTHFDLNSAVFLPTGSTMGGVFCESPHGVCSNMCMYTNTVE